MTVTRAAQPAPKLPGRGIVVENARRAARPRGRVRVYGQWCKGCGLCIAFCPQNVFEMDSDHRPVVAHPERCVACQWCVIHCPDFAILVEEAPPEGEGTQRCRQS